jgi:anti-sigma factor RsiW
MRCEDIGILLHPYLDGELTEEQNVVVSRHLLRCTTCGHEAHALEQTRSLLRIAVEREEPSEAFLERTSARLSDKLSTHLLPAPRVVRGLQWTLPFARDEQASG